MLAIGRRVHRIDSDRDIDVNHLAEVFELITLAD